MQGKSLYSYLLNSILFLFVLLTLYYSFTFNVKAGCCSNSDCNSGVCVNTPNPCLPNSGNQGVCVSPYETCSGSAQSSSCTSGLCCIDKLCRSCGGGTSGTIGFNRCQSISYTKRIGGTPDNVHPFDIYNQDNKGRTSFREFGVTPWTGYWYDSGCAGSQCWGQIILTASHFYVTPTAIPNYTLYYEVGGADYGNTSTSWHKWGFGIR